MSDEQIPDDASFVELAKRRGVVPQPQPTHGAEAVEFLNQMEAAEAMGDRVLHSVRSGKMAVCLATKFLDRLLKCYSEPLRHTRELAQIGIEIRKSKQ